MARFWTHLARTSTITVATLLCALTLPFQGALASTAPTLHASTLASADPDHSDTSQSGQSGAQEASESRPSILGSDTSSSELSVTIDHVSPAILTTEDQIQLTLSVTNTSSTAVQGVKLRVAMQASTPITATQLTRFFNGELGEDPTIADVNGPDLLEAGAQWSTTVTLTRDQLPLGTSFQWGPRGLSVYATSANGDTLGVGRSLIIWDSGYQVEPTHVGALVGFTQQSDTPSAATLSKLVTTPGVTMAVDAALLDPTAQITDSDVPMSGSEKVTATQSDPLSVITDVQKVLLTQSNELAILPRQDADLGVLAASGADNLTTLAQESATSATDLRDKLLKGRVVTTTQRSSSSSSDSSTSTASPSASPSTEELGKDQAVTPVTGEASPMITSLIWPDADSFGLQVLKQSNSDAVVVAPAGALAPTEDVTFTSVSPVNVDPNTGATALPEGKGTTVLTSLQDLCDLLSWQPQGQADQFLADQALNALTAIITKEKPNESRTLLATVARGTALNQELTDRLSTLMSARWVSPETVSAVASSAVTDVSRGVVTNASWDEQDQTAFNIIQNATHRLFQMADTAVDSDQVRKIVEDRVLNSVSADQHGDLTASATALNAVATQWYSQVGVEPTTTVNLINKTAQFPVRVTNQLPWDVSVQVTLDPEDNRLSAEPSEVTIIPAGQTATIDVPVRAIGSGDISVGYRLTTAEGFVIDQSQSVIVRLRAGWEDRFTLGIAVVFLVLFVVGIVRTIRKRLKDGSTIVGTSQTPDQTLEPAPRSGTSTGEGES